MHLDEFMGPLQAIVFLGIRGKDEFIAMNQPIENVKNVQKLELHDGGTIHYSPDEIVGEGAEKTFYRTEDRSIVVGIFHDQEGDSDPDRMKRLLSIVHKYNPTTSGSEKNIWNNYFCWPTAVAVSPKVGVLEPIIPPKYFFNDGKGLKKSKWFSRTSLIQRIPDDEKADWLQRIRAAHSLAKAIGRMHMAGLAHSDLSSNNVLVDLQSGSVMLIDIDSLVVPGLFQPSVLGTQGYIAPELIKTADSSLPDPNKALPTIWTDLHSLAVLIYEMLFFRHPFHGNKIYSKDSAVDDILRYGEGALFIENPDDHSNRPDEIDVSYLSSGKYLSRLFYRSFVQSLHDPRERPTALEWEEALHKTIDQLLPCENDSCTQKWFSYQVESPAPACPFCSWIPNAPPPVVHVLRPTFGRRYIAEDHYLSVWDNKEIYNWTTCVNAGSPLEVDDPDNPVIGYFYNDQSNWFLKNVSPNQVWHTQQGRVSPGDSVGIFNGLIVLFDGNRDGKVFYCQTFQ